MKSVKNLTASKTTVVGTGLASVLPQSSTSWVWQPHLLRLNLLLLLVLCSSFTLGFDASMMSALLSLESWNSYFGTPRSSLLGLMNAVLPLGVILGALPAGIISDRYGRKGSIVIGAIIMICASILQGASQNIAMFILSRFFIGLGIEFSIMPSPVLITELAYPSHRGKIAGLYNCFFYVGAIASSWTVFGTTQMQSSTWSWRIPSLLQLFIPTLQVGLMWFVPESPRWLISKGRGDEARAIFIKHHAGGDSNAPLVEYQMQEITEAIERDSEASKMKWSCLWATGADRKRLAVVVFVPFIAQWSGSGIITFYLSLVLDAIGITDSFNQTLINGILQIFNFFAAVFGVLLMDRLGRRTLWLWSLVGMLISYILFTACSGVNHVTGSKVSGIFVVVFIFTYFFHYDIAVTPFTYSYPAELLPLQSRGKGMALVNVGQGLALMFNAFVNPIALDNIGWKYYIVYCVIIVLILIIVYFFFPETRGHSLEELASLFDEGQRAWKPRKPQVNYLAKDAEILQKEPYVQAAESA